MSVKELPDSPTGAGVGDVGILPLRELGRRVSPTGLIAAVFLLEVLLLSPLVNSYKAGYELDSSLMQYDSVRVMAGQIPYRDFFNFPTPGTFWLQAAVFSVFGAHVVTAQWLFIVTEAMLATAVYVLTFRLTENLFLSLFPSLLVVLALAPRFAAPYHHWYAALAAVVSTLVVASWVARPRTWKLFAAGVGSLITGLFVQTQGLALAVTVAAFILIVTARCTPGPRVFLRSVMPKIMAYSCGVITATFLVVLYFWRVNGLSQFYYDTVLWPTRQYKSYGAYNNVPLLYNAGWWLRWPLNTHQLTSNLLANVSDGVSVAAVICIPLIAMVLSIRYIIWNTLLIVRRWSKPTRSSVLRASEPTSAEALFLLCSLATVTFFLVFLDSGNRDVTHMMWISTISYVTFVGFFYRQRVVYRLCDAPQHGVIRHGRTAVVLTVLIGCAVWYASFAATLSGRDPDSALRHNALITYIRHRTTPGDRIVSFPVGGVAYQFGRPAAISFTSAYPGTYYTAAQLADIARQIQRSRPKLVIFAEPNDKPPLKYDWNRYFGSNPRMLNFVAHTYVGTTIRMRRAGVDLPGDAIYRIYARR